jgi:hypothetical protein
VAVALLGATANLPARGFAVAGCLARDVALAAGGLATALVAVVLAAGAFPPLVAGAGAGDLILDAEAAVGFDRSVVIFRFGFSAGGGVGAPALDLASDAAVGA